jgi:hypothetical protein
MTSSTLDSDQETLATGEDYSPPGPDLDGLINDPYHSGRVHDADEDMIDGY